MLIFWFQEKCFSDVLDVGELQQSKTSLLSSIDVATEGTRCTLRFSEAPLDPFGVPVSFFKVFELWQ